METFGKAYKAKIPLKQAYHIILLWCFCFSQVSYAQNFKNASKFIGKWESAVALFPETPYMYFSKVSKDVQHNVFNFNPTGKITYKTKIPVGCDVGEVDVRDGMWKLEDENTLVLDVRGLIINEYWFWYRIRYKIVHITEQEIKLKFVKIIRKRRISASKFKWEDLISY